MGRIRGFGATLRPAELHRKMPWGSGPQCFSPHLCKISCPSQHSPTAHFSPRTAASHSPWISSVPSCWGWAVDLWQWQDGDKKVTPSMGWAGVQAFLCSFPTVKSLNYSSLLFCFTCRDTFAVSCLINQWRRVISPACPFQLKLLVMLVPAKGWQAQDIPKCFKVEIKSHTPLRLQAMSTVSLAVAHVKMLPGPPSFTGALK